VKTKEFIERVSERTGLDEMDAMTLTRATLRGLAERVTGGEANDIAAELPPELKDVMNRPQQAPADPFPVDELIERVSMATGLDRDQAIQGIQAVFATLREAILPTELDDLTAQLPDEWLALMQPERAVRRM
jgi:uncharacterized protein (DUF2267 family)